MNGPFTNVKKLLAFFQAHPNQTFSVEEILEATGLPAGSLRGAVQVIQRGHRQLIQPSRGFYRWDQPAKNASKLIPAPEPLPLAPEPVMNRPSTGRSLFELIGGPTSSGEMVLQSESGDLYLARKL